MQAAEPSEPRLDAARFRSVMSRYATGVSVVSTVDGGVRYGMTVNSFTSVSLSPLLVLFACAHNATLYEPLLRAGLWGVSVLGGSQEAVASDFAARGQPGEDRFGPWPSHAGPATGVPLLDDCLAWLECRTWATYDGGDHTIVVGEVIAMSAGVEGPPLLYFESGYQTL